MSIFKKLNPFSKHGIPSPTQATEEVVKKGINNYLPSAIKNLPGDVVHELVGRVIAPILTELFKPAEEVLFTVGDTLLHQQLSTVQDLVGKPYKVPQVYVDRAKEYYGFQVTDADRTRWARVLLAFGQPVPQDAISATTPMTAAEAEEQAKVWYGWVPFVHQLKCIEDASYVIEMFNKVSFYISANGNVTIGLYFTNLYDRAGELRDALSRWKSRGIPVKRSAIREFLQDLGPDALDITGTAKIEFGIVVGASIGAWGVPMALAEHYLDDLLKELGVPA